MTLETVPQVRSSNNNLTGYDQDIAGTFHLPDTLEAAVSDGDVIAAISQVVEASNERPVLRRPYRPDGLAELDVIGDRLEERVVRAHLTPVDDEVLAEEVVVAIPEQPDLHRLELAGGVRRAR